MRGIYPPAICMEGRSRAMSEAAIINISRHEDIVSSFEEFCSVKNSTLKGYMVCVRAFGRWMYNSGIYEPTKHDIRDYVRFLDNNSELKPGTKSQYLRAVKQLYKWAATEYGYEDITSGIKGIWKQDRTHHKKDALGREDVRKIAATIDRNTEQGKRLFAMFLLCVVGGLRDVELSRANVGDIKTISGRTYLYVWGKGHDEPDAPVWLIDEVLSAIKEYLEARTDNPGPKSPLFASTSRNCKGNRIDHSTISRILKKLLKDAGYDSDRITAHSLRHTSGTGVYKATKNLYLTQKHLRHANPETSEIYMHCEERESRNTERQVYDYYFSDGSADDPQREAIAIIQNLPSDKLEKALDILRALA